MTTRIKNRRRVPVSLLAVLTLLFLSVGRAWAHPRPRPHSHRKAVIVVGKPKPVRHVVVIHGKPHGTLDMNVKPKSTAVFVDGRLRGTCGEFDGSPGKLHLLPGMHRVKLVTPDGIEIKKNVRVRAGVEINVGLDLR
jgi:hypothetical protein